MEIKEITVFSEGDSLDLTCWSNVPYLFTKALERKGVKVNRVNIYSNKYIRKTVWKYLLAPSLSLLGKGNLYTYEQTWLNRLLVRRRIRKALARYAGSDVNVYMSYAYLEESRQPNVLFSDWPSEYVLRYRLRREPYPIERKYLGTQRHNIERAELVISLFPDIARAMREMYGRPILYLGQNVVNNVYEGEVSETVILPRKRDSRLLLFIGRTGYLEGARMLLRVFPALRESYPDAELHFIGLSRRDLGKSPEGVFCHGYLDKTRPDERALYYDLLLQARLFVNPTPAWGGYSSTVEAMYFYTPVIVSAYASFTSTFGEEIDFGRYVKENSDESLLDALRRVMGHPDYDTLCLNAHERVRSFTWDHFADRFLENVNALNGRALP